MTRAPGTGTPLQQELERRAAMVDRMSPGWKRAWHQGYAEALTKPVRPADGVGASEWRADVEDATGRPREVLVAGAAGRVNVLPPPGAGFAMDPDQAERLAFAMLCASNRARQLMRQQDGRPSGRDDRVLA